MSFINEESGVCLSETGTSVLVGCDFLIDELGRKYILTEGSKRIIPEGDCLPITDFDCGKLDRITVDSGKFVTIINTCNLPLTITGFKNDDPLRFSIFNYPEYSGYAEYNTGNTQELPFTVEPFQRVNINTFFHPLYSELVSGNAGTYENRTGDKFESNISILPGFEVLNCVEDPITSFLWWEENEHCDLVLLDDAQKSFNPAAQWFQESGDDNYQVRESLFESYTEDAQYFEEKGEENVAVKYNSKAISSYCSPKFKLEGEFVCGPVDRDFLNNDENFTEPDLSVLKKIQNQYSLSKKKTIEINTTDVVTVQNIYQGLKDSSLAYAAMLNNMQPNWYEAYGNLGISGALGVFHSLVQGVIDAGQDNDINNLLQSSLPPTEVTYGDKKIQVSYTSNNTSEVQLDGYNWTGMIIKNEPVENAGEVTNQAVFFNAEIIPGQAKDARMFIVDSGDFNNYPMKELI